MVDKEENLKILKYIGEVHRADMKDFANDPPPRPLLLLERLKGGKQGPTEL